jgi:deazaflavin-dependent oxidoreductase (nitroreductase family)
VRTDTAIGRTIQKVAATPTFSRYGPRLAPRIDRLVHRLTRGRLTVSGGVLPMVMLTATGAKSGIDRTTPLATVPLDGDLYVVGSNFGHATHPAWSANLIANPGARVSYEGEDLAVVAHLLTPQEKTAIWPRLLEVWPLWDEYTERSGRDLRVFRLRRA